MHVCCIYIRTSLMSIMAESTNYKIRALDVPLGISYISSSLKQAGYTTELVYCTQYTFNKGIDSYFEKEPQVLVILKKNHKYLQYQ